jgi:hypothetical protein
VFTRVQGPLAGVKITSVSLSNDHTVAVADFGGVFAWGCNRDGQLGLGLASAEPVTSPRCAHTHAPQMPESAPNHVPLWNRSVPLQRGSESCPAVESVFASAERFLARLSPPITENKSRGQEGINVYARGRGARLDSTPEKEIDP